MLGLPLLIASLAIISVNADVKGTPPPKRATMLTRESPMMSFGGWWGTPDTAPGNFTSNAVTSAGSVSFSAPGKTVYWGVKPQSDAKATVETFIDGYSYGVHHTSDPFGDGQWINATARQAGYHNWTLVFSGDLTMHASTYIDRGYDAVSEEDESVGTGGTIPSWLFLRNEVASRVFFAKLPLSQDDVMVTNYTQPLTLISVLCPKGTKQVVVKGGSLTAMANYSTSLLPVDPQTQHRRYTVKTLSGIGKTPLAIYDVDSSTKNDLVFSLEDPGQFGISAVHFVKEKKSSNLGVILPAVIVPVVVVLLAAAVGFWWWRRRRNQRRTHVGTAAVEDKMVDKDDGSEAERVPLKKIGSRQSH